MKDFDSNFIDDGFVDLGPVLDKTKCRELLEKVYETRSFGPELFIDEKQYRINPKWSKNNPGPGINLTEKFNLDFIENDDSFKNSMIRVLGPDYKIMLKKFVVGVPSNWLPKWINNETENLLVSNLATWIKPEFQDMTYFRGLDFHQDLIDHKSRFSDFITLYVYLDNVDMKMSPLVVIPKSHIFGATKFPHDIKIEWDAKNCMYSDRRGNTANLNYKFLTGNSGQMYFWSALTLHGTQPQMADKPRVSLRYLIERSKTTDEFLIDKFNKTINFELSLNTTRSYLEGVGKPTPGKILKS